MRARYVWDYDISEQEFDALLAGKAVVGRLDRTGAAARLIDSAPYEEVVRRIGYRELVRHWPEWRARVLAAADTVETAFYLTGGAEVSLKIEFVNDVRGRVGLPIRHTGFGLVDTKENIRAKKITALLDREEPKDLANVWGLCRRGA